MPIKSRSLLNQLKNTNLMLWGTLGYLFLFIFRPFEYWTWLGDYHIERVYMICLLIALLFWRGKRYYHHPITSAFIAFFLVICFSILIAYRPAAAIREAEEYFKLMVLFFVIILTVRDQKDFRLLIIGFIAIMGIYVGKSLWEFLVHGRHIYRMGISRLVGVDLTFGDPNTFAASVAYSLPLAWAIWRSDGSKWIRKGIIAYALMSFVAIMFTGSRSGMATLILFLFLIWVQKKQKFFGRILGLVGLVIVLLSTWQFVPDEYKLRYLTIVDDSINKSATESAEGRTEGLKNGLRLFAKSPLYGWGAGNFPYAVENLYIFDRMQSHNLYAQLVADLGFLGLVAFSAICLLVYRTNSQIQKVARKSGQQLGVSVFIPAVSRACLNTMILLLFNGNFGHNLYRYTWLLIGAILVLGQTLIAKQLAEAYRLRFSSYHMIFITKFRKPLLVGEVATRVGGWVREICASKAAAVLIFRLSRDRIRMLVVMPKRMSISELTKLIRVETSQKIFSEFKKLKDEFAGKDLWERSFVAPVTSEVVAKYLIQERSRKKNHSPPDAGFNIDAGDIPPPISPASQPRIIS